MQTLTNVLESIGDTRNPLIYAVNPEGEIDNIDDESFFYFFPHDLMKENKEVYMNSTIDYKTEVEDEQVEEYLLKCTEFYLNFGLDELIRKKDKN